MASYAFVQDGTATAGGLPLSARRLDTREWVMGLATAPVELVEACGWYVVAGTAPPAFNPATHRVVEGLTVTAGRPVQTWTLVALDAGELAEVDRTTTESALREQGRAAVAANRTFLAITSPTNAQNAAQIKALTRQSNGVIRLLLAALDRSLLDGGA